MFWGAMTDRPAFGLLLALIVEASNWTRLRWDFDEAAITKAWRLSLLALVATTGLIWLEGNRFHAIPQLFTWLPPLLLPMQFVQSYGLRDSLPLRMFSLFAKQRQERARRLGMEHAAIHFHFGNFYFAACLVSATLGKEANTWLFLPGLVVLSGWLLAHRTRGIRPALVMAFLMAAAFALLGQMGLRALHDHMVGRRGGFDGVEHNPNFLRTSIGEMKEIKLSPEISWRLKTAGNDIPPALLRTATYNKYSNGSWEKIAPVVPGTSGPDFQDLVSLELNPGEPYYLVRPGADREAIRPELPRFDLRGVARENTPLPLPGTASGLTGFELDGIERNSLGTVRIFPVRSVIEGTVLWRDSANPEAGPMLKENDSSADDDDPAMSREQKRRRAGVDLRIPANEWPAVIQTVEELGLSEIPTVTEKLRTLRDWFYSEFRYTRYLSIERRPWGSTEIGEFLTENRNGHCEYFATAAALMLREAGIPTRYAVGFAVMEHDTARGEWLLRGLHRHAWVRVWDASTGLWIDFDPTPPDWLAMETQRPNRMQWLHDAFQLAREDFFLWRNKPGNRMAVFIVMGLIFAGVLTYVARRLWKSRQHIHHIDEIYGNLPAPAVRTSLHRLESLARKRIGPRKRGQTFATWLGNLRDMLGDPAPLEEAISLHQRLRYDPAPPAPSQVERLAELASRLESSLRSIPRRK